jgi:hypothetical protein
MVLSIIGLCLLKLSGKNHEYNLSTERRTGVREHQMMFMSTALDVSDVLTRRLSSKMEARSIEIAKADGRFLVTPDDMRKAYEEIIREEHM